MNRKSIRLFLIIFILIVSSTFSILLSRSFANKIANDAKTLNNLGRIRGNLQRYSKLELANRSSDDPKSRIDELITYYLTQDGTLINREHVTLMAELKIQWEELNLLAEEYRKNPSYENKEKFVDKSEECWILTNEITLLKQYESEHEAGQINFIIMSLVANLGVVLIILILVKKDVYDNLEFSAIYDPLTKIFNRRYFNEYINNEIMRANRHNKIFCLIILDIDHFKKVNDNYGHATGDYVLEAMVQVVKESIRKSDVLARIGGEEFTILLPDTHMENAYLLAERIRTCVENHPFKEVNKITISLGITEFKLGDDSDTILKRADTALYKAKNNGRNRSEIEE